MSKTKRKIACMKKVKGKIDFVNGLFSTEKEGRGLSNVLEKGG